MQGETRVESAWFQRLNLKYDKLLLNVDVIDNLRPCKWGTAAWQPRDWRWATAGRARQKMLKTSQGGISIKSREEEEEKLLHHKAQQSNRRQKDTRV